MIAVLTGAVIVGTSADLTAQASQWLTERLTAERLLKVAVEALVLLPAAFLIEFAVVGWANSSVNRLLFRRTGSSDVDLLLYIFNELRLSRLLTAPLAFISFTGVAVVGNGVLAEHLGIAHSTTMTDPVLAFVFCFAARDFCFYWLHRGLHCRKFWPLHRLHHSASEMTVICSGRSNFLADFLLNFLLALPMSLFCLPQESIIGAQFAVVFHGLLIHSNWASDWGWFGRWVLVSPLHHRLHHGLLPEQYTRNMASMPLWDRLFGTFTQPLPEPVATGVQHPAYETVGGTFAMLVPELVETVRLLMGKPVHDPSVPSQE